MSTRRFILWLQGMLLVLSAVGCSPASQTGLPTSTPPSEPTILAAPTMGNTEVLPPPTSTWSTQETQAMPSENYSEILPSPVPTDPANPIISLPITSAWGTRLKIEKIPTAVDEQHVMNLYAVAPDAKFIVASITPRDTRSQEDSSLALVDVESKKTTEIARYSGPSGYNYMMAISDFGAETDGEWVVWQETYAIKAYSTRSGQSSTITTTPEDPNRHMGSAYGKPRVDHGFVIWTEPSEDDNYYSGSPVTVKIADLATGTVSVLSTSGGSPTISWPHVGWVEYPAQEDIRTTPYKGSVVLLDLQTQQRKTLDAPKAPQRIALYENAFSWSSMSGDLFLSDLNETNQQHIAANEWGGIGISYRGLRMSDRLVTWVLYPIRVWDQVQRRQVLLENNGERVSPPVLNEHALAWQAGGSFEDVDKTKGSGLLPNNETIYVLDTAQLPK